MSIPVEHVLIVIGAGSTIATAIFYGAFYLGQIWNRLDAHDTKIKELDTAIRFRTHE